MSLSDILNSSANPRRMTVGGGILGTVASFGLNWVGGKLARSQARDDHTDSLAIPEEKRSGFDWAVLKQSKQQEGVFRAENGRTALVSVDEQRAVRLAQYQNTSTNLTFDALMNNMGADGRQTTPDQMIQRGPNGELMFDPAYGALTSMGTVRQGLLQYEQQQRQASAGQPSLLDRIIAAFTGGDSAPANHAGIGSPTGQLGATTLGALPSPARPVAQAPAEGVVR